MILVVDDEPKIRSLVIQSLESEGYRTVEAGGPEEGLTLAREAKPAMIFLDVTMPGMDGFELCTKIHEQQENKDTPVVFLTALADPKDHLRGMVSGGARYLQKPFKRDEVLSAVHMLLG